MLPMEALVSGTETTAAPQPPPAGRTSCASANKLRHPVGGSQRPVQPTLSVSVNNNATNAKKSPSYQRTTRHFDLMVTQMLFTTSTTTTIKLHNTQLLLHININKYIRNKSFQRKEKDYYLQKK